jgi:hypothetical protein
LEASPATEPVTGWRITIARARRDISRLLDESPSIRPQVGAMIAQETPAARRLAAMALTEHGETPRVDLQSLSYGEDQVLGDWFPQET